MGLPRVDSAPLGAAGGGAAGGAAARGQPGPALSGALAGLAGGGLGAAVYAMHCTEDSPLFWVTWYGTAIVVVTVASTLIGSRVLRW